MGKKGSKGLVDFYLDGFPHRKYARAVFKQGISDSKRNDSAITWDQITDLYTQAIYDVGIRKKEAIDLERRFSQASEKLTPLPPLAVQARKKKQARDRREPRDDELNHVAQSEAGHAVRGHDDEWASNGESDTDHPDEHDQGDYESEGGYDTAAETHEVPDEAIAEEEPEVVPDDVVGDQYLFALVDGSGRRVCFDFARTGKCGYQEKTGKCSFSHDSDLVAKFKAAELLGPGFVQRSAKAIGDLRLPPAVKNTRVHVTYNPGHKERSGGIRAPFGKRAPRMAQRSGRRDN